MVNVEFERIYLNQSKNPGRLRIADSGLGWKEMVKDKTKTKSTPFLLPFQAIVSAQWSRASKGWELRIQTKENKVVMLDGFDQTNFNQLKNELKRNFNIELENREHILRGWNWGTTTLARSELVFNINNRPTFELPYQEINNTNLTGKNEVAVEFKSDPTDSKEGDELVEMRFYVPGTVEVEGVKREDVKENEEKEAETGEKKEGEAGGEDEEDNNIEEQSAAVYFYDQLKEKASLGQVAGEAIASFSDIFFLTPRGRYDVDMYSSSLRLRGKTYDNKVQYRQIERIFSLPKPDDTHHLIIAQVDPPLSQGQTKYSFITMQFPREEILDLELNLNDEEYNEKYKDKLEKSYEDKKAHMVVSQCLKGLSDKKLTIPGMFRSRHNVCAVNCSLKASEGYLYFLDKSMLFLIKPTLYIPFSDVLSVQMSRVGQSSTVSKTFDLEVSVRNGSKHLFANIARDEQKFIESFLNEKDVRVKNEEEEGKAILNDVLDDDDDDSDAGPRGDDDDESEDEDFNGEEEGEDSDDPEEYDSQHSSGGEDDDDDDDDDDEGPAKKKKKKA